MSKVGGGMWPFHRAGWIQRGMISQEDRAVLNNPQKSTTSLRPIRRSFTATTASRGLRQWIDTRYTRSLRLSRCFPTSFAGCRRPVLSVAAIEIKNQRRPCANPRFATLAAELP